MPSASIEEKLSQSACEEAAGGVVGGHGLNPGGWR